MWFGSSQCAWITSKASHPLCSFFYSFAQGTDLFSCRLFMRPFACHGCWKHTFVCIYPMCWVWLHCNTNCHIDQHEIYTRPPHYLALQMLFSLPRSWAFWLIWAIVDDELFWCSLQIPSFFGMSVFLTFGNVSCSEYFLSSFFCLQASK